MQDSPKHTARPSSCAEARSGGHPAHVGQAAPSEADQPVKRHHALSLIGLGAVLGYTVYALLPTVWGALRLHSKTVYRLDRWLQEMAGV